MKTYFTKAEIRACHHNEGVLAMAFIDKDIITMADVFNSNISISDKWWFAINKCDVTLRQQRLAIIRLLEYAHTRIDDEYESLYSKLVSNMESFVLGNKRYNHAVTECNEYRKNAIPIMSKFTKERIQAIRNGTMADYLKNESADCIYFADMAAMFILHPNDVSGIKVASLSAGILGDETASKCILNCFEHERAI